MKKLFYLLVLLVALSCIFVACDEGETPPPADEHVHAQGVWQTPKEASCTEAGKRELVCPTCQTVLQEETIAPTGHTPGAAATCTTPQLCSVCQVTVADATGHSYQSVVTPPTCTATGYTTHTCACGDSYQDTPTPIAAHTPGAAATCTAPQLCSVCQITLANATGHSHQSTVTPPTCTTPGYTIYACACGDSYTADPVDPHHTYENYVCSGCQQEEPGLYNAEGDQLADWETLTTTYGMNVTKTYTWRDYNTTATSPYCVLTKNASLQGGVKLVLGEVAAIGECSFYGCTMLTSITIAKTVTQIGDQAFYRCTGLTSLSVVTGNTTYHSAGNCLIQTASGVLVRGCSTSVIPTDGSVTAIGAEAFAGYATMTTITIPSSITSIGSLAFYECQALDSISFLCMPSKWSSISFGDYWNEMAGSCTVSYPSMSSVVTPSSCLVAGYTTHTCSCCNQSYTDTPVPAAHKYGANNAPCTSCGQTAPGLYSSNGTLIASWDQLLQDGLNPEKNYSDTVFERGMAFVVDYFNYGYKLVVGNVSFIGNNVFRGCNNLVEVEIPENVAYLGKQAFSSCPYLQSVKITSVTTTSIGESAFATALSLTSLTLPPNLTTIGSQAFFGCVKLQTVNLPESVTEISFMGFSCCDMLTTINLPAGLLVLGTDAFSACKALTSIHIPANITTIEQSTFSGCLELSSVTFAPNSKLTTIAYGAFSVCPKLTQLDLPTGVTSVYRNAFSNSGLVETVGGVKYACNWVVGFEDDVTDVTLRNGTIGISSYDTSKYYRTPKTLQSIIIPASVKYIGAYAFYECDALTTVTLEQNSQLQSIGNNAFQYCTLLESFTLPAGVTTIGQYAFGNCAALATVTFAADAQLTTIGDYVFYNCTQIQSMVIPTSVVTIGKYAFGGCSALASVTFATDGKLATIGEYTFYNCTNLKSIAIPASVTTIGKNAFTTSGLTSATLAVKTGWMIYSFQYTNGSDIIEYYLKYAESSEEIASYLKKSDFGSYEWRRSA